jgi:hypothetical protein
MDGIVFLVETYAVELSLGLARAIWRIPIAVKTSASQKCEPIFAGAFR